MPTFTISEVDQALSNLSFAPDCVVIHDISKGCQPLVQSAKLVKPTYEHQGDTTTTNAVHKCDVSDHDKSDAAIDTQAT